MGRLPTSDMLKRAFGHLAGHLGLFEAAAWPWLAGLALWHAVSSGLGLPARHPMIVGLVEPAWLWLADIAVAVTWHRAILLAEPAPGRPRFGRAEFRYLVTGAALACFVIAPFLPAYLAAAGETAQPTVNALLLIGAVVASIVGLLAVRFYLALPAAAIGSAIDFAESWRRTSGNGWRLLLGLVASTLPGSAAVIAWDALIGMVAQPGDLLHTLADLVSAGISLAGTALIAGFLSFSYLWFDRPERDAAGP